MPEGPNGQMRPADAVARAIIVIPLTATSGHVREAPIADVRRSSKTGECFRGRRRL